LVEAIRDHAHVVKKKHLPRPGVGARLAAFMEASVDCRTQTALAKKARVSQSTGGRLLKGLVNSQSDTLKQICDALGISVAELLGELPAREFVARADADALEPASKAGLVPLISWVQAGSFTEAIDIYQPGFAEQWVKKPPVPCGSKTFALRVEGMSMEPKYQEGEIIYVDPEVAPANGKDVVIRLDDRNEVTFKRLVIEGRRSYLRPLNRSWREQVIDVPDDARIVGVVLGAWMTG
jgi:SOS-response transcriptional repressor LexA